MPFTLEKLPYNYDALEPYLDSQTLKIHHTKHHQGYINKLNAALEKTPKLYEKSIEEILKNLEQIPKEIKTKVINFGGGHASHILFWKIMKAKGGGTPKGKLAKILIKTWGSFENFKEKFSNTAKTLFGSGWVWLVKNKNNKLEILGLNNQDNPLSHGYTPIMNLDVWEHAYYLKYKNKRADFIDKWWKVINWEQVENNFLN